MREEAAIEYRRRIENWRMEREKALASPDGWLALTGLFMLQDGEYSVGSGADNSILLPPGTPEQLGTMVYSRGKAHLVLTEERIRQNHDAPFVLVNGAPIEDIDNEVELDDNRSGQQPTVVTTGTVSFFVHRFGDDVAIRIKDSHNPGIQAFAGCEWFEIDENYCVQGELTRHSTPLAIPVENSVRTAAQYQSIGTVSFVLKGEPVQLLASASSSANELFLIFRDGTAGKSTYGAGRYLYADMDEAGHVTLDFNKAYNPPCAFTPYATCSRPPFANQLLLPIEAGERYPPRRGNV